MTAPLSLTPAETRQLSDLLRQRHKRHLGKQERFEVTHQVKDDLETVCIQLHSPPGLFRFEAAVHPTDVKPRSAATELLLDFLDGVLEEWFTSGRTAYPTLEFTTYEFEGAPIGLRGGSSRPDLEAEADRLLGLSPDDKPPE